MEKKQSKYSNKLSLLFLFFITIVGVVLRFNNLSPFKLYPDSYQNLLVAENIHTYHNVVGFLGTQGMPYPDFFMWTRPMYPLLINLGTFISSDTTAVARSIAFLAGTIAIPLVFFFFKNIFKSSSQALAAAFLLALSFNHTVWSGFIMTETLGILFMLLFLWSLFFPLVSKLNTINLHAIITGIFLCIAVLTRYEYSIILLAASILIINKFPHGLRSLITIVTTFILSVLCIGLLLYPWQSTLQIILIQSGNLLQRAGIIVAFFLLALGSIYILPHKSKKLLLELVPQVLKISLILSAIYLCLPLIFPLYLPFLWTDLFFVRHFIQHDFLIFLFAFFGSLLILNNQQLRFYEYFVLVVCLSLGFIYHRINPDMERYLTHLIPFLLIPASYALSKTITYLFSFKAAKRIFFLKIFLTLTISLIILLQLNLTFLGLRYLNDPSWYHNSYEEKIATKVKKYIEEKPCPPTNTQCYPLILASFPEPYFYILRYDTYSLTNTPPYIYIPNSLHKKKVIIVEDMGMHDIFPSFTVFLEKKLQSYKKIQFVVNEKYHYTNRSEKEGSPVTIYEIPLDELKKKIKQT